MDAGLTCCSRGDHRTVDTVSSPTWRRCRSSPTSLSLARRRCLRPTSCAAQCAAMALYPLSAFSRHEPRRRKVYTVLQP
ncbi:hypothetical protein KCP70_17980 [Salmonella enterica subsp. enterica]|nr:hypothetical protein KCP70_17980 [Salmonella enterica subsp. enterica]